MQIFETVKREIGESRKRLNVKARYANINCLEVMSGVFLQMIISR